MRRKNLLFISFLALFVIGIVMVGDAAASSETTISVDPPVIWDEAMGPGAQFTVDIVVDYVENLWAYQIELYFNPEVIQGVSYENGPFMESQGGSAVFLPGGGFDNTEGKLALFGAYLDPMENYPYGEDGVLAAVTFEVVGYGKSSIVLGDDTGLTDAEGEWIISHLEHGHFANAEVHDVAVTYISTSTRWCQQGDPIYITVIVENLGDFTETFDAKVYSVQMGGSGEEIFIGIEAVEDLAPEDSKTLFFVWDTTEASVGSYNIYAEAVAVEGESAWIANNNIVNTPFGGICVRLPEPTLLDLVISWVNFAVRAALPVSVFVTVVVVFFKTLSSVRVRWPTRLSKIALRLHGKPV